MKKRKKKGENARYWLSYCEDMGQYRILEAGVAFVDLANTGDVYTTVGGSDDLDELILFVREMNLMVIAYRNYLSCARVIAEFEKYVPYNLTIFQNETGVIAEPILKK